MTYYEILGVPRNATLDQIRKAYREQAKFFHPDVFTGPKEVAEIKMRQLNEAHSILAHPEKRKDYDAYLDYIERKAEEEKRNKDQQATKEWAERVRAETDRKVSEAVSEKNETEKKYNRLKFFFKYACSLLVIFILLILLSYSTGEKLQNELDKANFEIEMLETRISNISNQNNTLTKERDTQNKELSFWRNYAVIVTESGKKYHTYGCQYIQGKSCFIYNRETAKKRGYTACSSCKPLTSKERLLAWANSSS